ncbi:MAG: S49 family peptidase [Candidatus Eisenbacteria bacterium]
MKAFLRTILAVLVADALLFGLVVAFLAFLVAVKAKSDVPQLKAGSVLVQEIDGPIPEYQPPSTFPFPGGQAPSHTALLENLEKARHDERIRAVVLRIGAPGIGWAKMDEIRERIRQLREARKPVWAYLESLGSHDLYLACACDSILLMRNGYVSLHGFASERPFLAGTLEKIGVKPDIDRIGKYKSAAEMLTRTTMSPESRANADWMIDAFYRNFLDAVEGARRLDPGTLETRIFSQGVLTPREALESGLVDRLVYWDQVESSIAKLHGVRMAKEKRGKDGWPARPRMIRGEEYAKVSRRDAGIDGKKTIAVVHAQGLIGGEKSGYVVPFGMTMGSGTMEQAFRQAVENDDVKAIVFRVDSGGGESSTSWKIGHVADRAQRVKPVVVSMSDVAASGAYMISYPCSTLVANRLSVVGSIGSISGKMNLRGLYEKLGITKDFVTRGPNALFDSDYFDYTPEQWESFTQRHFADYWEWVEDVARERGLSPADVDSVGRGRVWTGEQALERHLIDRVGTFDDAVTLAKQRAGIPAEQEVKFLHYPRPEGFFETLRSGGFAAAFVSLVRNAFAPRMGEGAWAIDPNSYRDR